MFSDLLDVLKERVTVVSCHTVIQDNSQTQMQQAMDKEQNRKMSAVHNGAVVGDETAQPVKQLDESMFANVARNDLCPCGSGKKFKHCHGRITR